MNPAGKVQRPRQTAIRKCAIVAANVAAIAMVAGSIGAGVSSAAPTAPTDGCPDLYVFGVQGTGQSTPTGSPTDTDSGMLGDVFRPLKQMAASKIGTAVVPYDASFGGAVPGGSNANYEQSVEQAIGRLTNMVKQVAGQCPNTKFAAAGYSQGAHAVSSWAKAIGAGNGPISADKVAAVALFGDPARPQNAPLFPGSSQQQPAAVPGTSGQNVSDIQPPTGVDQTTTGGGIGPTADVDQGYGQLAGRVADICQTGDLACAAPSGSPIVHLVTNIAGQTTFNQKDPIVTLETMAQALAMTTAKTVVPVINNDISGTSLDSVGYEPTESISQRLADASDPRTPLPSVNDALNAVLKVGTIGLNTVVTLAKNVFTPDTIASLAAVGLANPPAALGILGAKLAGAVVQMIPPVTVNRWATEAFDAIGQNLTDNQDILNVSNDLQYWNAQQAHGSYSTAATSSGTSATLFTAQWFAAAAYDIAGQVFSALNSNGQLSSDTSSALANLVAPTLAPASTESAASTESVDPNFDPNNPGNQPSTTSTPAPTTDQTSPTTTSSPPTTGAAATTTTDW